MFEHITNPRVQSGAYTPDLSKILGLSDLDAAQSEIETWPGYKRTELRNLNSLAVSHNLGGIFYKDEGDRFGLGSFKALGGAYAVKRLIARLGTSDITVCCATDGNHGRSVAWGAERFGCNCRIYIHSNVSEGRKKAIERFGAKVVRTGGNYDDSVRQAAKDAADHNWYVVSDTSYPGYTDIPKDVMAGYMLMAHEAFDQASEKPTHLFLQGGVGGLAAAVLATSWQRYGDKRPRFIVAEPDRAACIARSIEAGRPQIVEGELDTIMAGLACGEVSLLAWELINAGTHDAIIIDDDAAISVMRTLAAPTGVDPTIVAGESATCGLAAALQAANIPAMRAKLELSESSQIMVFGTESDTDPQLYTALVGMSAEQVRNAGSRL